MQVCTKRLLVCTHIAHSRAHTNPSPHIPHTLGWACIHPKIG